MSEKMNQLLERMRKVASTKSAGDGLGTVDPNRHANEGNAAPFAGPPEDATTMRTGEQAAANASQLADATGPAHHEHAAAPGNATDDVDTNSSGVTGTTGSSPELSADGASTNGALDENKTTLPGATTEVKSAQLTIDAAKKLEKNKLADIVKAAGTAILADLAVAARAGQSQPAGKTQTKEASEAEKRESFEAGQAAGKALLEQQKQLQYAAGIKVAEAIEYGQTCALDLIDYLEARRKQAEDGGDKSKSEKKPKPKKAEGEGGEEEGAGSMPVAVEDASGEEDEAVEDTMGSDAPAEGGGDELAGLGGGGGMGGGMGGGDALGGIDPAALAEIVQLLTQAGPGALPEDDMMALEQVAMDPMGMGGGMGGGGMVEPKMGSARPQQKQASPKKAQAERFNRVLTALRERINK